MIKAIVFDLDGVLYLEGEKFSAVFSKEYRISYETVMEFFKNEFQECLVGKKDLKKELNGSVETPI